MFCCRSWLLFCSLFNIALTCTPMITILIDYLYASTLYHHLHCRVTCITANTAGCWTRSRCIFLHSPRLQWPGRLRSDKVEPTFSCKDIVILIFFLSITLLFFYVCVPFGSIRDVSENNHDPGSELIKCQGYTRWSYYLFYCYHKSWNNDQILSSGLWQNPL